MYFQSARFQSLVCSKKRQTHYTCFRNWQFVSFFSYSIPFLSRLFHTCPIRTMSNPRLFWLEFGMKLQNCRNYSTAAAAWAADHCAALFLAAPAACRSTEIDTKIGLPRWYSLKGAVICNFLAMCWQKYFVLPQTVVAVPRTVCVYLLTYKKGYLENLLNA